LKWNTKDKAERRDSRLI